jgi:hypothetical protein
MLKKRFDTHYYNQANPEKQPKPKNQAQNTTAQPTCAHKTPTTTTKKKS